MSELSKPQPIQRGHELICEPTNIPVDRALVLQTQLAMLAEKVDCTMMTQDDPRRYGMSAHYETIPMSGRNPDDFFDHPEGKEDQSTHLTYQVKHLGSIGHRMAIVTQQYTAWPQRSSTIRQYHALQWNSGDEFATGARRDVVFTPPADNTERPGFRPVTLQEDTLIFDEDAVVVELWQRPLALRDIDSLEQQVRTFAKLKAKQPRRRYLP